MTLFERMLFDLQLLHMNLQGKHAEFVPPCSDLMTLVHTREGDKRKKTYRGGANKGAEAARKLRQERGNNVTAWLFQSKKF